MPSHEPTPPPDDFANVNLAAAISDDGLSVTLNTLVDGQVVAFQVLNAAELESAIHALGEIRQAMAEAVTPDLETGMRFRVKQHPAWWTEPYKAEGGFVALRVRDPGFGWLGYTFPPDVARQIGANLTRYADEAETSA
jgi:hypothetical protein